MSQLFNENLYLLSCKNIKKSFYDYNFYSMSSKLKTSRLINSIQYCTFAERFLKQNSCFHFYHLLKAHLKKNWSSNLKNQKLRHTTFSNIFFSQTKTKKFCLIQTDKHNPFSHGFEIELSAVDNLLVPRKKANKERATGSRRRSSVPGVAENGWNENDTRSGWPHRRSDSRNTVTSLPLGFCWTAGGSWRRLTAWPPTSTPTRGKLWTGTLYRDAHPRLDPTRRTVLSKKHFFQVLRLAGGRQIFGLRHRAGASREQNIRSAASERGARRAVSLAGAGVQVRGVVMGRGERGWKSQPWSRLPASTILVPAASTTATAKQKTARNAAAAPRSEVWYSSCRRKRSEGKIYRREAWKGWLWRPGCGTTNEENDGVAGEVLRGTAPAPQVCNEQAGRKQQGRV